MTDSDTPAPRSKVALAPDVRRLDDRAARAWTERMAVRPLGDGRYAVDSESGATYVADLAERTCTCPDSEIRGETCKHLRRVAIEITAQRVPPPGTRRVDCAACGVETLADRSADPPALCATCRLEPGDIVRDREAPRASAGASGGDGPASRGTGDRLVVHRVRDRRADEVRIEAADCTVADYETNADYPDDDPVVEAAYLSEAARPGEPTRYSFPLSRLERVDDAALVA